MPRCQNSEIPWRIIWLDSLVNRELNSSVDYLSLFVIWALTFIWTLSFVILALTLCLLTLSNYTMIFRGNSPNSGGISNVKIPMTDSLGNRTAEYIEQWVRIGKLWGSWFFDKMNFDLSGKASWSSGSSVRRIRYEAWSRVVQIHR